ncbi:MAG TPA: hypothetical protein VFF11_01595, partial [Candidatus Binatia bacterium]|nr:hypothetical protein [Candidatus Binatia bacterium]
MKKKSVSTPELPTTSDAKARSTSKTDVKAAAEENTSISTKKKTSAPRKPLLDTAVDAAKNIFKGRSAAKKTAKGESQVEVEAPTVVR